MGEFRIDHATIAFRLALAEASEQEQARADALAALWQRPVFAATWPSPNEAPRTLTNSHGETALPLFTGLDTLEVGADRFNWREPNGSIRFREMPAREALRYALTRQVNFVVLDVGFEHNVEFAREELESLLLQKDARPSAAAAPVRQPSPSGTASRQASPASAQPAASAPPRAAARVSSPAVSAPASAAPGRALPLADSARARASVVPQPDSIAPKHPSSVPPNLPLSGPGAHDAAVSPRLQSGAVPIQQPSAATPQEASPRQRSGAVPIQHPPLPRADAPESARDVSVHPQRSQAIPPRRRTISASPPPLSAYPPPQSEQALPAQPEIASQQPATVRPSPHARPSSRQPTLTQSEFVSPPPSLPPGNTHPQASFVPPLAAGAQLSPRASPAPPALPTTPPRAAGELRRTPPPVPEAAKSRAPSTPGTPAPASGAPVPTRPVIESKPEARRRSRDDEPTLAERPNRATTQRGLQASVPDTTLESLSTELRGFPEVEWACVLADDSDLPLIGVRIDPSFLNRVADITDVILDVGERQSVALQVLLLNNQDLVKNARRNGRAFYPWTAAGRS